MVLSKFSISDIGDDYSFTKDLSFSVYDLDNFANLSQDRNPIHTDHSYAVQHGFKGRVVYGALLVASISEYIGMKLPGQNTLWMHQSIDFKKPVYIDDVVQLKVEVKSISEAVSYIEFKFKMLVENNVVAKGQFGVKVI